MVYIPPTVQKSEGLITVRSPNPRKVCLGHLPMQPSFVDSVTWNNQKMSGPVILIFVDKFENHPNVDYGVNFHIITET